MSIHGIWKITDLRSYVIFKKEKHTSKVDSFVTLRSDDKNWSYVTNESIVHLNGVEQNRHRFDRRL